MKNKTLCRLVVAFSLASIFLPSVAIAKTIQNEPGITRSINELSWLSGRWKSKNEKPSFEEHWMTPHDGSMVGMGRELNDSKMEFFEYLRIEQRKDGVFVPGGAGPNPERKMMTNNAGNLKVIAELEEGGQKGEGHLIVTVQRWNNPPLP